ncbi:MAG: DUF3352 domain-containing protein [Reichenbachiella sp.]|uniref:DUF3352 domain-containing protein n=1 Tax=Reichenbachiella sp. TaxID=2184521 RepID=UPI0032660D80
MNQENEPQDDSQPVEPTDSRSVEDQSSTQPISTPVQKKKSIVKKIVWLIILAALLLGAWKVYKLINPEVAGPRIHPLGLIPDNALYILETDKPYKLWSEVNQTRIWDLLQGDEEWQEYGQMMTELEETLTDFDQALDLLTNRTIYISGHPYRSDQTDLLFVFDLEGLGVIQTWMTSLDHVSKRSFKENVIYEKLDLDSKETLYFAFENNYLIASFTHTLVEESILSKNEASLTRTFDFIDIRKKVLGEGLVRIYVNYESLYTHLGKIVSPDEIKSLKESLPFRYSGFYFNVDKESLLLEGYSNYNDSLFTYLNLFPQAGTGGTDIAKVLPAKTSVYMSLGFDSFQEFYVALVDQLSNDPESGETYQSYTARTEKFLGIALEEDLAGWIDDELALVQFEMNDKSETAFILKAKSATLAKEKMSFLSHQIKRKTPVRFKTVSYRNHEINYMAVKGLFNLILGKLFTKYDRPYYAIIDQFVIFSDRPKVLRRMIDQWLDESTLANVPAYEEFSDLLGTQHSAFLYMQLELLGKSNGGILDSETVELLQSKRNMISHFPQFGFNISPAGKMFETKLLLSIEGFDPDNIFAHAIPFPSLEINLDSLFQMDPGEQIVIQEIEVEDLAAKKQTEAYEEGSPKYELEIKDGLKHGSYFEYHPSGELKTKGKYKNDLKEGTWKYYTVDGKLESKEKYKKGERVD